MHMALQDTVGALQFGGHGGAVSWPEALVMDACLCPDLIG